MSYDIDEDGADDNDDDNKVDGKGHRDKDDKKMFTKNCTFHNTTKNNLAYH